MRTDHLFEYWNTDSAEVLNAVVDHLGPCDVFIGGSLADDLGTTTSDIDLYCFVRSEERGPQPPVNLTCGEARLEVYVVNVAEAGASRGDSLRRLIAENPPVPPSQFPLLSPQRLRQLHALYRDRALRAGAVAEEMRVSLAPDLLHIYASVRATLAAGALAEGLLTGANQGDIFPRLYHARLIAELAIDAALATHELVNPNPKWRLHLSERAALENPHFPPHGRILGALFPEISVPEQAISQCLALAAECMRLVAGEGTLRRFPAVTESVELIEAAAHGQ